MVNNLLINFITENNNFQTYNTEAIKYFWLYGRGGGGGDFLFKNMISRLVLVETIIKF